MKNNDNFLTTLSVGARQISEAQDLHTLRRVLKSKVKKLGFDTFNLAANKRSARAFMTDPTLTTWSQFDLENYDRDGWFDRDVLLARASSTSTPLLWKTDDWKASGHEEYHEYLGFCGIKGGLTVPLGHENGRLSALTLLGFHDGPAPSTSAKAAHVLGTLLVARTVAIGATPRSNDDPIRLKYLSGTQMEILKWIAAGKSNLEISVIIDLPKRTVDYHVGEILGKLDVSNRAQAAVIYTAK